MPYCEKKPVCVCHGYRCCDPPVIPGVRRTVRHCYEHGRGCHKRCKKKPGRKKKELGILR
jgi:hypothetical protein